MVPPLPGYEAGPGIFSKIALSPSSGVRRFLQRHTNSVTHSAMTTIPTTVKVPATAPVLAKKLFGDADVACAADVADVEVGGNCLNVEEYVVGGGRAIVVTATGDDDVLEVDRVDLDG